MTTNSKNRLLANRYQLQEMIGKGAMGQVYRAKDMLLGGVNVSVKILSQALQSQKSRERFEREATISALLAEKSIHIVKVRDYGVDENNIPFYVMDFLQGGSLSEMIKSEKMSLPRFLTLTRQICLGLDSAHKGIVFEGKPCPIIHRDIKPNNIFVVEDQILGQVIKLLDFGIAKLVEASDSQTNAFMGTIEYCSPEQMEGGETIDRRSDIYSLGIVMYEMLAQELPYQPTSFSYANWYKAHHEFQPKPFNPKLKILGEVQELVLKCLAKKPGDRYQSVGEILQVIEGIQKKETKTRPTALKNLPPTSSSKSTVFLREIYADSSWPEDKPQQKIVFPSLTNKLEKVIPSLWVMLEEDDIIKRMSSIRYNQFLFQSYPHPMVLWVTVLYNREQGPRWLPCYLDLKTDIGKQVVKVLAESEDYHIVLFALNKPQQCLHVIVNKTNMKQRALLKRVIAVSQALNKVSSQPQISKKKLKEEFEHLKPKIIQELESANSEQLHG
ncbi:MAG: serine/threonine protein kinase [Gomphosphaeria aponina SAG 52.96 = DSM 107014]|uniref:Serine/threonine protein kinase n=1 Tax=Gomphosphaeria aponina SAG 52.96 = DSM 107014 TaxID=1521640 RepID=A0A941GUI2_9CHRO|nr:serine/threonine protein kinase [Gomphosphaeria aponina SAG 52.96 = DSM 107014]